ncbi:DUF2934 domain-containing protein [Kordiimonas aestuarii]|uniref:DUF2934 domain-containing protein n=1 Tax=Kordiimonas aestuarii TaxID=1005925 RepID=UPI0021D01E60|nr:DUF2934 domain-containing protein [Kordiimonas aestuarii]
MAQLSHEQISQRSFMIWEQEGRPIGQDLDHWLRAERELAKLFTPVTPASTPKKRAKSTEKGDKKGKAKSAAPAIRRARKETRKDT